LEEERGKIFSVPLAKRVVRKILTTHKPPLILQHYNLSYILYKKSKLILLLKIERGTKMSKTLNITIASILMLAVYGCSTTSPDTMKVKPALKTVDGKSVVVSPLEQLTKRHVHSIYFSARGLARLGKNLVLPKADGIMCGQFNCFAGKNTKSCVIRNAKEKSFIIDLNRNDDLTDDKVYPIPDQKPGKKLVFELNGQEHTFSVVSSQNPRFVRINLKPTTCWNGGTMMQDKQVSWVACDCSMSGSLDDADTVYIDMNDNGFMIDTGKKGNIDEFVEIGPESIMYRNNKWYSVAGVAGNQVEIGPYKGEMSTIKIDSSEIVTTPGAPHSLKLSFQNWKQISISEVDPIDGVKVPARVFQFVSGIITTKPKAITYYTRNLDFKKDFVLKLEKPGSILSVNLSKGKINVNQKITAPNNVNYSIPRSKPGPIIEIFSEKNPGKPVTKGNMKYG
jgi:hypothetical protein